jgi:Cytochrome C oxidase, cbb3-type, subunit III
VRYVRLLISILPAMLAAQDGSAIYKERCASCHDAAEGHAPKLDALKAMSGEAVLGSLAMGSMKPQAEGLTPPQIFALVGFIAPTGSTTIVMPGLERSCKGNSVSHVTPERSGWNGWSRSCPAHHFINSRSVCSRRAGCMPILWKSSSDVRPGILRFDLRMATNCCSAAQMSACSY